MNPVLCLAATGLVLASVPIAAASPPWAARIEAVLARPQFRHGIFGIEVFSLDEGRVLYAHNGDTMFIPGSVTKLLTAGTALRLLGADYRYHTPVYRTGPLSATGELDGDLVLVASGDPNLSNRVRADGSLAFENADHAYGHILEATLVPGDPLQALRSLARQAAASGVQKIRGRVLVDVRLFPEGTKEGGTGVVISPIAVNDNVIDVLVTPGLSAGSAASLEARPPTTYARFENAVETAAAGAEPEVGFAVTRSPSGELHIKVSGTVAAGSAPRPFPFLVPEPREFARAAFTDALKEAGIEVADMRGDDGDWDTVSRSYTPENRVAEHVSPPLAEDVKVTLKVSQNLHAAMMPYVVGAVLGRAGDDALNAGFARERELLTRAGLDASAAAQSDGAGAQAYFTPDLVVRFLAHMAAQKEGALFKDALPVLGRDGSLWNTGRDWPAAGRLRAKTGTHVTGDLLNEQYVVDGKGLAGYLDTVDGKRLVVAVFANHVPTGGDFKAVVALGDALAEIATAPYDPR
jgi:PBP4 family serine-type D-alanyl-D-alanine carboxypeptidase